MKIKTITGSSIHTALAEARRLLGDEVVLLESVPPNGSEPARITVMVDTEASQEAASSATEAQRIEEDAISLIPAGYGYGAMARPGRRSHAAEENARPFETFSPSGDGVSPVFSAPKRSQDGPHRIDNAPQSRLPYPTEKPGRGRLFPHEEGAMGPSTPVPAHAATARLEELLDAQLKLLHDRLDALERRLDGAVVGASQRWVAHPLFAALLGQGLRPATVASLFDKLVEKGYDPATDVEKLKWTLAHEVRSRIAMPVSRQSAATQVFIGPSGAGKTSLALKLTTHPNFFARSNPTVIVITPEDIEGVPYQTPIDLYRRFGIPVQSVQTEEEMGQAMGRLASFDQVLIDTPPIPAHEGRARKTLLRISRMVEGLMPLEVQFVINATRTLEGFGADYFKRLPLRPGTVALTHLDEISGWGRIADWLIQLQLPVRFVSTGPKTPDDLSAFSPTWFVERMMELG